MPPCGKNGSLNACKNGREKKSQPAWQCPEACVGAMIQWDTKMQESTQNRCPPSHAI